MSTGGHPAAGPVTTAGHTVLSAGTAQACRLAPGATVRVTNLHGSQVVDTWALSADSPAEHLSMEHTRAVLHRLSPRVGDALYSNQRRPLLTLTEDTSPGIHDTLIAACDQARYRMLGHHGFHRNCSDNFQGAIKALGIRAATSAPLNLFMNIAIGPEGTLSFEPSASRPGDHVTLTAHHDLHLILSACPQDLVPINGLRRIPTDVEITVSPPMP